MRVALASFDKDAPADVRESQIGMGLDDVIAELVIEYDWTREQVEDRVEYAIDLAFEDKVSET